MPGMMVGSPSGAMVRGGWRPRTLSKLTGVRAAASGEVRWLCRRKITGIRPYARYQCVKRGKGRLCPFSKSCCEDCDLGRPTLGWQPQPSVFMDQVHVACTPWPEGVVTDERTSVLAVIDPKAILA